MMTIRKNLLSWQYADYGSKHRSRFNLWLHIVTVPLFWGGAAALIVAALGAGDVRWWLLGAAGLLAAFAAQAVGHKTEPEAPEPFLGAADFFSRFVVEQLVTFPRFVVSGGWLRGLAVRRG
jgi:hypothetical protein